MCYNTDIKLWTNKDTPYSKCLIFRRKAARWIKVFHIVDSGAPAGTLFHPFIISPNHFAKIPK